jgi:RHS repeat-associated protein
VTGQTAVTYGYDSGDRLMSITQGTTVIGFGYDNADRRTSLTMPGSLAAGYGYDDASQLLSMTFTRSGSTIGDLAYTYDASGRRATTSGSYARLNLPAAVTSAIYNANNQLTKWGNTNITYDLNGSMNGDGTNSYSWNARGQLSAVTKSGQTLPSFTYDAFGRRQKKTVGATVTSFLYDGANTVQELTGASPSANLLTGLGVDELFQRTEGATARTFVADALGSVVALADSAGVLQTSYTYAPYGATTVTGTASNNTSQFTGRENDSDGLYFYRARYYHPLMSRFVSEDPFGFGAGNANLYGYVHDSPTNLTDPSGKIVPLVASCAVSAATSVVVDLLLNSVQGRKNGIRASLASAASGCIAGLVGMGVFSVLRPLISRIPLFRAVGSRELETILRTGNYGSGPNLAGKYFALAEQGARNFATSSFNSLRTMTITSVNVPRWMTFFAYSFDDVGAGGAGASLHFSERMLPWLYRFMSGIRILGAP